MALLIHPDGKQEFLTLQGTPEERRKFLTARFDGDKATVASDSHIEPDSVAAKLKFQQLVIMYGGGSNAINKVAARFGGFPAQYRGIIAFLREYEMI